ncbi:MAG: response regulator [Lachnospiraceae bacterium]|nr:response regulator [Lachnospiraceae bacterium]
MGLLKFLFMIFFIVSVACGVVGAMDKRRNNGFLAVAAIIAAGDLICVPILGAQDMVVVSKVLLPYQFLHAWFLFAILVMIILVDRYRQWPGCLVLSAGLCIYQTYLVVSQYMGARIFSFQRRIFFGKAFWVAVDTKNTGLLFSYRSYRVAGYLNLLLILIVLIGCIRYSHRIFRSGYIAMILIMFVYSIIETLRIRFLLPVWVLSAGYNIISVFCLYLTGGYARSRLREWSLDSFANDMSDGLILYDKHDDLIHINDMVKNTLPQSLIADFEDKKKLEEWVNSVNNVEGEGRIAYKGVDREHYFRVTVRVLGGSRGDIGTLYILHDSTDSITRLQAMEQANEELERAGRMKSDFLANMSHEIRTPMNAVIGMAELAIREKDSPQLEDYLLQIQSSGKNLLNIINDILDYSKIESGKMEILEEEYEPNAELSDIAGVLNTRIGTKPLLFFVTVETKLPRRLCGDAMRIRQVLINLANNAIKFTKAGLVGIQIRYEDLADGRVNMVCHVKDTGIGIRKEDIGKLFVSFQQVDSRRNRSVEGTGLGLAISQRLVEAMGGRIGVTSEYGKGSDFWFEIPQKVVDATNDMEVEDAAGKYVYLFGEKNEGTALFLEEMRHLGAEGGVIASAEDYTESGKKEFLFIDEMFYDDRVKAFLGANAQVTGLIWAGADFDPGTGLSNVHILRKPVTTMSAARALNERYQESRRIDEEKIFQPDFVAPEAKILVVDDNPINLTIAEGLLATLQIRPDMADGGQSAIERVKAEAYDIVFMDHMMPDIDGVDATKLIRSEGDAIHQPVIIALSANVMEEARKLFKEAGMNDFVGKPIDIRELSEKIRLWLPKERISSFEESRTEDEAVMKQEQTVFASCRVLDTESAVRALGSAALYDKIIGEYYRSGEERFEAIREAFDGEDWENYTIRVHALKSSSRQIGAMELGKQAEDLEMAGKAGDIDTIRSDTGALLNGFESLLKELTPYFEKNEAEPAVQKKPVIDRGNLEQLLKELEANCNDLDMDGMEEADNALKEYAFEEEIAGQIEELHKAVANIDTEQCLEIIAGLRGSM